MPLKTLHPMPGDDADGWTPQAIDYADGFTDELDEIACSGGRMPNAVRTGFMDLDARTDGLRGGQLIVVAGRPGMGKSTFAEGLCREATYRQEVPSAYFTLETDRSTMRKHLAAAEARVRLGDMTGGRMTDDDWIRTVKRLSELDGRATIYVEDDPRALLGDIEHRARQLRENKGVGLIVVDCVQLLRPSKRMDNRWEEVAECARSLKLLARELNVPVVLTSQLNRNGDQRYMGLPKLSDLAQSGSLEQFADVVILLHRPDWDERDDPRMGEADLHLAKNVEGTTGTITVAHQLHYRRFVDMEQPQA